MKITYDGGSSSVFKSALNAPCDNIWTSSIIYTLYLALAGEYFTFSLNSLISSTLLFDAASISTTSIVLSSKISLQFSHSLQGSSLCKLVQFTALENIFAVDVFPVPLVPQNKYAWPTLLFSIWFFKVLTICSWPITSLKFLGLYTLYNALCISTIPFVQILFLF